MAGEKVLLVDDTRLNRELAKDILELNDYQVVEAVDGKEALKKALESKPDIILLDIELPDISGLEVLKRIKEDSLTRDIPVVALTSYDKPDVQQDFLSIGFAGFILKPFDTKNFSHLVAKYGNFTNRQV